MTVAHRAKAKRPKSPPGTHKRLFPDPLQAGVSAAFVSPAATRSNHVCACAQFLLGTALRSDMLMVVAKRSVVMREDELGGSFAALRDALETLVRERPELRRAILNVADWMTALAEEPAPDPNAARETAQPAIRAVPEPTEPVTLQLGGARTRLLVPGTREEIDSARRAGPAASAASPAAERGDFPPARQDARSAIPPDEPDLLLVARRARLKVEGCRWAVTRRARLEDNADFETAIRQTDVDIITRAKALEHCYVWPLDPYTNLPNDKTLEDMAACYDNLAAAAELVDEIRKNEQDGLQLLDEAYTVLAETQSAVRAGLQPLGLKPDRDQDDTFRWLRIRSFQDQVMIPRFMRLNDPADPAAWMQTEQRIGELRAHYEHARGDRRARQRLMNKARYHARKLSDHPDNNAADDWSTLCRALNELIELGLPPSDADVREILLPILEGIPDDLDVGEGLAAILREVDRYVASRESVSDAVAAPPHEKSPETQRAADLLRGSVVVLIGGQRRPKAREALERELELRELRWIETNAHQSLSTFAPDVARPETALVLLAIRWSSHSFEGVKDLCQRYGKPFVRLPGGYSPNQVAAQIVAQASDVLAEVQST